MCIHMHMYVHIHITGVIETLLCIINADMQINVFIHPHLICTDGGKHNAAESEKIHNVLTLRIDTHLLCHVVSLCVCGSCTKNI